MLRAKGGARYAGKETRRPRGEKTGGHGRVDAGLAWLLSFLLVVLAVLLMLLTTLGSAGYMKSRVSACGYGETAYVTMRDEFISYGAATAFRRRR